MENQALKEAFRSLHAEIARDVNPDSIIDALLSKKIISDDDYRDLRQVADSRNRCRDLFSLLYPSSHPKTFIHVREALLGDYPWIVDEIDDKLTPQTAQLDLTDGNYLAISCGIYNINI